jgi:hypothetical protein
VREIAEAQVRLKLYGPQIAKLEAKENELVRTQTGNQQSWWRIFRSARKELLEIVEGEADSVTADLQDELARACPGVIYDDGGKVWSPFEGLAKQSPIVSAVRQCTASAAFDEIISMEWENATHAARENLTQTLLALYQQIEANGGHVLLKGFWKVQRASSK